jgi:hypothetical protein
MQRTDSSDRLAQMGCRADFYEARLMTGVEAVLVRLPETAW